MGHTRHAYDEFDSTITRPLYGYVTELKQGTVPRWVQKPRVNSYEAERLLDAELSEGQTELARSDLPAGISKDTGGRGPTRFPISRTTYLELHQERIGTVEEKRRFERVEYTVKTGGGVSSRRNRTVPSNIEERLNAVMETSDWDRRVDGYHVNFSKWVLVYELGPRGGIVDVRIEADLNH